MNQALHLPAYPVTDGCIGGVTEFEHTQSWIYGLDNPYLHGVYAPTTLELSESGLQVEGQIPKDLLGTYFRNGPNPIHKPENRYHPFDGDGMVHAVSFCEGRPRIATATSRRWRLPRSGRQDARTRTV